jgi:aquaporin Z
MEKTFRPLIAELVGTFFFVLFGAGIVCVNSGSLLEGQPPLGMIGLAVAQGLVLAVLLSATVPSSGGFLNPALVLVLWVFRRLESAQAFGLVGVQLLGAGLAGLVLRWLFAEDLIHHATPHVNLDAFHASGLTLTLLIQAGLVEMVITALVVFVIFATLIDRRAARQSGLAAGLAYSIGILFAFPLTGAAGNPARAFGLYLWDFSPVPGSLREHLFVYWVGALSGALVAAVIYVSLILPPPENGATAS